MNQVGEYGAKVRIMNSRPRNLSVGGMIKPIKDFYMEGNQKIQFDRDDDVLLGALPNGSLVIPRQYIPVMKEYTGKVTGKKVKNNLIPVLLEDGEMIIHPEHAQAVETFLKKKGLSLPLKRREVV